MFRPANSNSVFADIVAQIEEAIITNRLKPGDKLPPERELQQTFESSRGPVREALKTLEQKGLLEIKNGPKGGAIVRKLGTEQLRDNLSLLIKNKRVPTDQLAEFRESVEGMAGALAAQRISPQSLTELTEMFTKMTSLAKNKDMAAFWALERKMHCKLAKASGNLMFEWVLTSIHQELPSYGSLYPCDQRGVNESLDHWRSLLGAIEQGEIMLAESLSKIHVRLSHMEHHLVKDKLKSSGLIF